MEAMPEERPRQGRLVSTGATVGKQSRAKRERRKKRATMEANNPMSHAHAYGAASLVLGEVLDPAAIVERLQRFDWKLSFVRVAYLASMIANDPNGPRSPRARDVTVGSLTRLPV